MKYINKFYIITYMINEIDMDKQHIITLFNTCVKGVEILTIVEKRDIG